MYVPGLPSGLTKATTQYVSSCPVTTYNSGGPGYLDDILMNSYQAKGVFTDLLTLAGHHVIKAGVTFNLDNYRHDKGYSGADQYQQATAAGGGFNDLRNYGFLTGAGLAGHPRPLRRADPDLEHRRLPPG